jgi:hypothetical protein
MIFFGVSLLFGRLILCTDLGLVLIMCVMCSLLVEDLDGWGSRLSVGSEGVCGLFTDLGIFVVLDFDTPVLII